MKTTSPLRRDAVLDLLASFRRALHVNEIAGRLGLEPRRYPALQRLLDDLSFDGTLVALPGQRFKLTNQQVERRGAEHQGILSVNPRGFGFVTVGGLPEGIYIPPESLGGGMHGDTVSVRIASRSRRGVEGEVLGVVKRRHARVAGTLRRRGKSAWLEPDDNRLRGPIVLIADESEGPHPGAIPGKPAGHLAPVSGRDGSAVVCRITRFPETADENPEAVLEALLGEPGDPKVEVAKILLREGIEEEHPVDAVAQAEAFGAEVAPEALIGREDLTYLPLPTIDPEDARDHDDAVWVVREEDGSYKAWIAIADVSHYVRPDSALDREAVTRGNSIYLPDRAIPMLPRALSSNLCSLLPGQIRLCLCVEVELDPTGDVRAARVLEAYMRSIAKLTYSGVARTLGFTQDPPRSPAAEALRADLAVMWDLARLLRAKRMRRGALDFDLPEARVIFDPETGAPADVRKRTHDPGVAKAYQLIEEMMLLANEVCAQYVVEQSVPTVFRYHAPPDQTKLERFATMCEELDIQFDPEDAADPKRLSAFLKKLQAHPQKQVLHMLLLRAMKQAVYDVTNVGHFGLASSAYLHFTSPIRRYPDITAHRAIRALLRGEHVDRSEQAIDRLKEAAMMASDRERKAMEIEREIVDLHRALVMRSRVGEIFAGTVTGIVGTGVFVNIDDPFVDVLVRMESLGPDQYDIDEQGLRVIGARSGDRIGLGDSMLGQIEDVSILRRTVFGRRVAQLEDRVAGEEGDERDEREGGAAPPRRRVKRTGQTVEAPGPSGKHGTKAAKASPRAADERPARPRTKTKARDWEEAPKKPKRTTKSKPGRATRKTSSDQKRGSTKKR
ncbi:MAG TPA: VacB/RNase II family 3'-5' exoribonuclease [Candidatus Nanopelagicales bacterium]|nr:VacB/RNase II family 3'-5' exoribonuclease [Candidatus Nanopelagicales bacterium]